MLLPLYLVNVAVSAWANAGISRTCMNTKTHNYLQQYLKTLWEVFPCGIYNQLKIWKARGEALAEKFGSYLFVLVILIHDGASYL